MRDVIVIGAGPSGLNAAKILKRRGFDVLTVEKKAAVGGHVICAGIVGREVFDKFDLRQDSVLEEIQKIRVVSPNINSLIYEHPSTFAYAVDRDRFDRHFFDGDPQNGWDIELNSEVNDIQVKPNSVAVYTKIGGEERNKHSARMVIIATGVRYDLHRKLGLGVPKDYLHGVQAECRLGKLDCTHVFVGRNVARGGFAWLVPTEEGKARVGLITEKDPIGCFHRLIKDYYPDCLESLDESLLQFKPIAQGLVSKTYGERVLALGEAAGQVKTTTGGGIYFGLLCSEIAAQVVCERFDEGDFSKSRMASYEKLWKKAIQKEIIIGYYARKFCAKLSDKQIEKTLQIIQTDGFIPMMKERGNFDWHSELVLLFMKQLPFWQSFKKKFGRSI